MKNNFFMALGLAALICGCQTQAKEQPATKPPAQVMEKPSGSCSKPACPKCSSKSCKSTRGGCCEADKPQNGQKESVLEEKSATVQQASPAVAETVTP